VLITGARGQLGSDLVELLPEAAGFGREELPVADAEALHAAFERVRPELVFNCAAYNAVDRAESEPEAAMAVNALGPELLARECAARGARLVHFSTNYVFDGALDRPYLESDPPRPLGAYARSKREGEERVLCALPEALVIRGSALFGVRGSAVKGGSFPERILARARAGERLRVVADQTVNPTYTADLARAALELATRGEIGGVVHLVPGDCCSWWELAVETLRLAGLDGVEVAQARTAGFAAPAPRPLNGCLASERVPPLRSWREGLAAWAQAASRSGSAG
jgi:dTDP-4-dehydrorhamnose reductase